MHEALALLIRPCSLFFPSDGIKRMYLPVLIFGSLNFHGYGLRKKCLLKVGLKKLATCLKVEINVNCKATNKCGHNLVVLSKALRDILIKEKINC